ncbi:MAG: glycoside hydrolase family 127 protein [Clostridia bacterium]|nr:glycoside hydrolase family 127 protein [Clostridia bacterium]
MKTSAYRFFTIKELSPRGWLRRQLELEAEGLCGNLDKVWPDVRDSQWIGGDREGWERVPYWLDGFIPLAYLLDNEDMKARAGRYIDRILASQCEDGWICPNGETPRKKYDIWAIHLIAKVLVVWYDCTEDERIPEVLYRIMKNFYDLILADGVKIFDWGKYRWFEGFVALNFLRARYPHEEWIPSLAKLLKETGSDYRILTEKWKRPLNQWTFDTHVVNLAMMLKSEAVSAELLGEEYSDLAEKLYSVLMQYNGMPVGTFTGDECLSGLSPIQGTELCGVVELMYSFEWLYAYTGDAKWAERLERVAFNALPAAVSDDMWTHQYVQLSNQIDCTKFPSKPIFRTNGREAHLFGLEPHYGCCTSNFGQGWPKLALSAFMKSKDGIVSAVAIPSELKTDWNGDPVKVTLDTQYPFRNTFTYTVEAAKKTSMKLRVRVPSFARSLTVNGKKMPRRAQLVFERFEAGKTVIEISYETQPKLVARPHRLYSVNCGSLVFALPIKSEATMIEYEKNGVERKFPYCDYEIRGKSDWNYAFASRDLRVEEQEISSEYPFSSHCPPVVVRAALCHVDWGFEDGYETVCAKLPQSRAALDAPETLELYPYGCAKLRMTELPLCRNTKK